MIRVLKQMTYKKDLPLAIHDCIIIPKSKKEQYTTLINKYLFNLINNIINNNNTHNLNKHIKCNINNTNNINKVVCLINNNNNEQHEHSKHIIMKILNLPDEGGG